MLALAILAIIPAIATPWFTMFWLGFAFWRRHQLLTYATMAATVGAVPTSAFW